MPRREPVREISIILWATIAAGFFLGACVGFLVLLVLGGVR